jgi:hypothetical protein
MSQLSLSPAPVEMSVAAPQEGGKRIHRRSQKRGGSKLSRRRGGSKLTRRRGGSKLSRRRGGSRKRRSQRRRR